MLTKVDKVQKFLLPKVCFVRNQEGTGSLKHVKVVGSVPKVFDKEVKGYIFSIDTASSAKIQIPKEEKISLGLIQPYLVLQVLLSDEKQFSLELVVTDTLKVFVKQKHNREEKDCSLPLQQNLW
eukprot:TRINITY_DN14463_c0_g1_i1.p1 TRINITY_DN14463_c0_g1~~TRINITY_DN14463_c0_g1_i1.p1  ORF type:complete len:124 (-),score=10.38 TRINITY_DN14463_c0_g1_i1:136-507(-)